MQRLLGMLRGKRTRRLGIEKTTIPVPRNAIGIETGR
jgi:hypothetical protein